MQKAALEEHDPAANEWDNTKPSEHIIQSAIYVHQMTVRIWVVDLIGSDRNVQRAISDIFIASYRLHK